MTPVPLRDVDYFGLAEASTMNGFSVHQTFDQDPEIYRFEFSSQSRFRTIEAAMYVLCSQRIPDEAGS
jgi:hypothetical protein